MLFNNVGLLPEFRSADVFSLYDSCGAGIVHSAGFLPYCDLPAGQGYCIIDFRLPCGVCRWLVLSH